MRVQSWPGKPGNEWAIKGTGDFNNDRKSDILWRASNGQVAIWWSGSPTAAYYPGGPVGSEWTIQGAGDFDSDLRSDILWRHTNGQVAIWWNGVPTGASYPGGTAPEWRIQGTVLGLTY